MSNQYFKSLAAAAAELKLTDAKFAALVDAKLIDTFELGDAGRRYVSNAELARFRREYSA